MRIVERAVMPPAKCIVTGDADGPFIDTERWSGQLTDAYLYLHKPLVEEMARDLCEMAPRSEVEELREQLEAYRVEVEKLRRFAEAKEELDKAAEGLAA